MSNRRLALIRPGEIASPEILGIFERINTPPKIGI